MTEWNEVAQREAEALVFRLAASDPDFRALALRDGRAAVEQATGRAIPEGFTIRFVDPAGAHLTAVLPRAAYEQDELADYELMAVAGGKGGRKKNSTPWGDGSGGGGTRPQDPAELPEAS